MAFSVSLVAVLALLTPQDRPQDPPPTVLSDVVVEGVRRDEKTSFDFVRAVSAPPLGSGTMAVRIKPLCLAIDNLRPEQATALSDRILGRAQSVGVQIAEPDCKPNVSVIFSADGAATAKDVVRRNRANFRPTSGPTQLDRASLARFTDAERAVRWWNVNMPVDVESGRRIVALAGEHIPANHNPGNLVTPGCQPQIMECDAAILTGGPPWRVTSGLQPPGNNIRESLLLTVVVVDARLTAGMSMASIGDYLAMVVLSQADPEADLSGLPTILNLFAQDPNATELTQWDADYLKALYETPVRWSHIRFQQQDIARRMVAAVSERAGS